MDQNEVKYDKLLKIKTTGRDDSRSDQYCYPYEPTPYGVLERLAYCGYLGKKNHLIDYGCGKGRVDFFLAWQVRCRTTYISYLMTVEELEFLDEIDCQDLFEGKNQRERILVFQMGEE